MTTKTNLLAFMTEPDADGKYDATKPTDEQLAVVLPWLIDKAITFAHKHGYCAYVNEALPGIFGKLGGDTKVTKFYTADGYDCEGFDRQRINRDGFDVNGYDRDGYNRNGRDRNGYSKEGFDRYGYNRDGFNADGRDRNGYTREEAVAKLVGGWTSAHLTAVAAKLAERQAAAAAEAAVTEDEPVPVAA